MSHGGGGGKEAGVFGVDELAEASTPVWEFLGFLVCVIPFLLIPDSSSSHH